MASVAAAIAAAKAELGKPYVWGATGPNSFDCSGLTQYAWKKAGVDIPRTSQEQATYGTGVKLAQIQAGDLVTSDWGSGPSSHVALYLGGGQVIQAPAPGKTVTISALDANYIKHLDQIRRVPGATGAPAAGGATATDWSWNPFSQQYWDQLGQALGLAGDAVTGGAVSSLGGTLLAPLADIATGVVTIAKSFGGIAAVANLLMKLALPTTWVRIAAGLLGVMFVALGIGFLIRETAAAN